MMAAHNNSSGPREAARQPFSSASSPSRSRNDSDDSQPAQDSCMPSIWSNHSPVSNQFNFVGRILGPRGLTAKQLEAETGCKIMVRGKGSMRDKKKEEQNRGKPNWEHLNEDLHVLITVEDAQNRAEIKLKRAVEEVNKLLVPAVSRAHVTSCYSL
ncbi:protein quaking-like [Tachysurus ichikawai]